MSAQLEPLNVPSAAAPLVTVAPIPGFERVRAEGDTLLSRAKALVIKTREDYLFATDLLKASVAAQKTVVELFRESKKATDQAHAAVCAAEAKLLGPIKEVVTLTKSAISAWDTEQERLQREAERLAQEQARKAAEDAALAEAAALEREAAATGDVSLQQAAEDIIAAPVAVPTVSVAKATPKVAGIAYTETWKAEVTDLAALVRYIAVNPAYLPLLTVNQSALNQQARSLRGSLRLPGVKVFAEKGVRAGGAR